MKHGNMARQVVLRQYMKQPKHSLFKYLIELGRDDDARQYGMTRRKGIQWGARWSAMYGGNLGQWRATPNAGGDTNKRLLAGEPSSSEHRQTATSIGETRGSHWDHAGGGGGGASRNSREGRGIKSERDGILELGIDDINRWLLNIMIETEMR